MVYKVTRTPETSVLVFHCMCCLDVETHDHVLLIDVAELRFIIQNTLYCKLNRKNTEMEKASTKSSLVLRPFSVSKPAHNLHLLVRLSVCASQ